MSPQKSASDHEMARFDRDGFLIIKAFANSSTTNGLREAIQSSLDPLHGPAEFEADVQYPGAPGSRESEGGDTPRRLLHAYGRNQVFRDWATSQSIKAYLQVFLQSDAVLLSQCHHNCIMTKYPGFSSMTSWHQDNRYWRFDHPNLVSVWLALGEENSENGGLMFIPGTHKMEFDPGRLDKSLFLRTDLDRNQSLIEKAVCPELSEGDVVFFHSQTFHAAGMNLSDKVKLSPVFTYHADNNQPIPGTTSSIYPSIPL